MTTSFPSLDGAWPIVGHLPEMYRRFPALCARGEARHGPLFWIEGGPGARQLMCTDACALEALKDPAVSTSFYSEGFAALLANTLFAFDAGEHRRVRGALAPAFTPARILQSDVLPIISEVVSARLDAWVRAGRVEVLAATREIALEIIFRIIGVPHTDVPQWHKQYARYLLGGLPSRGRGPLQWLAQRAREWLDARLGEVVDRARRANDTSTLVGAVAHRTDEHGTLLDRSLVVANLRLLVLAGHETTASALAWNVLHLASSPHDQRRAMEEAGDVADLCALATDKSRFTFAEAQFREALRLYPAVHSVIRRVTQDLALDVGTVPCGTLLNVPLVHLLREPKAFPEPHRYEPDRWTERPHPGTMATAMFGGGPHFCLGYHIAIAEGTLFNLHLAQTMQHRRIALRRPGRLPAPIYLPLAHPPRRAAVELEARS
jgi:cytochrome P450